MFFPDQKAQFLQLKRNNCVTPQPIFSEETDEGVAQDDFRNYTTTYFLQETRRLALPVPFPVWRSQTRGMLPIKLFLSSHAVQLQLMLSQILSELSQFLLPDQCHQWNTGHIPTKFQDLNKSYEKQMT